MKISYKIILINIFFIILFFTIAEIYSATKYKININNFNVYKRAVINPISIDKYFFDLYNKKIVKYAFTEEFRKDINTNNITKSPILFLGCSFTYGQNLNFDEIVSSQFAKITKRPIYNRSGMGWGLSQMLYQAKGNLLYKDIKTEPEYIIYFYISDHINRIDKFKIEPIVTDFQPKYKYKNNVLEEEKPTFFDRFVCVQLFQYNYQRLFKKDRTDEIFSYFLETEKYIRKQWKNTKFVIVKYPIWNEKGDIINTDPIFIKLSKTKKFTIINANDLTSLDLLDDKNKIDGWHPSANVWVDIVPNLIKKLNI